MRQIFFAFIQSKGAYLKLSSKLCYQVPGLMHYLTLDVPI